MAANLPVINDLADKAEERIRKGTKEKGLHEAVQNYKDAGYNGVFCVFLLDSIYEYALYHNEEIMRIKLKTVGGHMKDQVQPGFEQLRRLLTAFPAGTAPELDGFPSLSTDSSRDHRRTDMINFRTSVQCVPVDVLRYAAYDRVDGLFL